MLTPLGPHNLLLTRYAWHRSYFYTWSSIPGTGEDAAFTLLGSPTPTSGPSTTRPDALRGRGEPLGLTSTSECCVDSGSVAARRAATLAAMGVGYGPLG